jgi:hypothetical protein
MGRLWVRVPRLPPLQSETWSRGPAATTPGLHPGNDGSSPSGSTCFVAQLHVLAEQPGVLASLSRWRSWVQIPSRTLSIRARYANWQSGEAQTFVICGFDSRSCHLAKQIGSCSSWRPVKPSSQNKRGGRREVQFLHDPLDNGKHRFGPFVYRHRTVAPQAAKAGSIPARVIQTNGQTHSTKW